MPDQDPEPNQPDVDGGRTHGPLTDTVVTFPAGGVADLAEVLQVVQMGDRFAVVTDVTPFHPVDHRWPDQGADRGVIRRVGSGESVPVADAVLGAVPITGMGSGAVVNLLIGPDIPVRPGEPGWVFVVVHVLPTGVGPPAVGERVELLVDEHYREALSFGHTACHLASLALNEALAGRWRKPVETDGFGRPNFDQLAIDSSRIGPDGAVDCYRLGKSLRKKGFDSANLEDELADVELAANLRLAEWLAVGPRISVETRGPHLADRREWVAAIGQQSVRLPCGGTHPQSLAAVWKITVRLSQDSDTELRMETKLSRS